MNNKNKLIVLVIMVALVAIPYWRINQNSQRFADGVFSHLNILGEWTRQDVGVSLDGQVTFNRLTFKPSGYRQTISIDSIQVQTDLKRLLFSSSQDLLVNLPKSMTLTFNNARLSNNASDLQVAINQQNYWPMAGMYLGAFGCGAGKGPSFTDAQWQQIFPTTPSFNLEVSYSLVDNYNLDFNFNINSINNWFIAWSGTLARTSDAERISFDDTIIKKLYYLHSDQGFNQKRNALCAKENKDSFAAYRLNSAEEIQKHLRVFTNQEMPDFLSNQYQRALSEDMELNAIFELNEPQYVFEFVNMSQTEFYSNVNMEVALGENEYQKIELKEIDFIDLDMDTLRAEMEAKNKEAARLEAEANKPKELLKTVTRRIGGATSNEVMISDWSRAVGQNIKVRTKRGRPIFGRLLSINDQQLTISSKYMRGNATISVARKDVVSMSVSR